MTKPKVAKTKPVCPTQHEKLMERILASYARRFHKGIHSPSFSIKLVTDEGFRGTFFIVSDTKLKRDTLYRSFTTARDYIQFDYIRQGPMGTVSVMRQGSGKKKKPGRILAKEI